MCITVNSARIYTRIFIQQFTKKRYVGIIRNNKRKRRSIDLQKAFDTVWHHGLFEYLLHITNSFLLKRKYRVKVGNTHPFIQYPLILRIILHSKFIFTRHILQVVEKIIRSSKGLHCLLHRKSQLHVINKILVDNVRINPILTYGCEEIKPTL